MRASKCEALPRRTSLAMADSAAASRPSARARPKATHASPVIMLVPFMSDRASLGRSASGVRPQRSSAARAVIDSPRHDTSRSPMSTAATYDSGVRSPLAPTDPSDGMRGRMRWRSRSASRSSTTGRTPE